jgi:hypothetical protein
MFSPTLGSKGARNRESGCKKASFLPVFSYLRASPIWPDFGRWQAGQICALWASIVPYNVMLPLVMKLFIDVASITASAVAYCDARNGQIVRKMVLLTIPSPSQGLRIKIGSE